MYRTKRLITEADPLGPAETGGLSPRAQADLAALVPDRPARRGRRVWVAGLAAAGVLIVAGAVGAVVLRTAAPPPPSANQAVFGTTEELENRADTIVRATVRDTRPETGNGTPETVATVEVSRVAKGDAEPGRRFDIVYTTPRPEAVEAPTDFRIGREYVFLITDPDDAGLAHLISTFQGWYAVRDDRAVPDEKNAVRLSPDTRKDLHLR